MLSPYSLLSHADRLLEGSPNEADIRRAVSAAYYAVFHLLSGQAAAALTASLTEGLTATLRRSAQHKDMRRVCDAVATASPRGQRGLEAFFPEPISPALRIVAKVFVSLQADRHAADYDVEATADLLTARVQAASARELFELWADICTEPNSRVFLAALLLSDKWTRRG